VFCNNGDPTTEHYKYNMTNAIRNTSTMFFNYVLAYTSYQKHIIKPQAPNYSYNSNLWTWKM